MTYAAFKGPCPVCHHDASIMPVDLKLNMIQAAQAKRIAELECEIQGMIMQSISDFGQHQAWLEEREELLTRLHDLESK